MKNCIQKIDTAKIRFSPDKMYILGTKIPGLQIIRRPYFGDKRGGFQENYRLPDIFNIKSGKYSVIQSSVSDMSPGTRKGIHCERQEKLITFNSGEFFVVELDIRSDSPTFGKYVVIKININTKINSSCERISIAIPKGIGNSMQVIQPRINNPFADIFYQVSEIYDPHEAERVIVMDDPELGIEWPKTDKVIISKRDQQGKTFINFMKKYGTDYVGLHKFK